MGGKQTLEEGPPLHAVVRSAVRATDPIWDRSLRLGPQFGAGGYNETGTRGT